MIGIATGSSSTTTATYPIAESLPTTTPSIAPGDFTEPVHFMEEEREDSQVASTDLRHHTLSLAHIPARSAASIMEEPRKAFPHAGNRASVEVSTEAEDSTAVEAVTAAVVTGDSVPRPQTTLNDMETQVMRTNNMKLEAVENFPLRLACWFASSVLAQFLLGLLLFVGFA